ncbi:MAG: hypothetical protein SVZ03_16635 [Spirochaetota bacterium]|nr:hypothetical protein [Spirochaetota bacterium]
MKKCLVLQIILIVHLCAPQLDAEDYQYQYFKEKKEYTPFSDYIPKVRLHYKTVPHYLEDYYQLYGKKQYYNENSLRKNIERLKRALECRFRHPSEALIKIETKDEYLKYRRLMFMHINILIMRNYLRIASRYDKRRIYFYNLDFAKEIRESLDIAEGLYRKAIGYWNKAKGYAEKASNIRITTDLGFIESERYSIIKGELNYRRIIDDHIKRLKEKRKTLNNGLASMKR